MPISHDNARILYGVILLLLVGAVVALIVLGHSEDGDHYPLMTALAVISVLAGAYAKWFQSRLSNGK